MAPARAQQPNLPVVGFLAWIAGASNISLSRSAKAWVRPAMSSTAMSASTIAGRKDRWIDCRRSHVSSCALRSR